MLQITAHMTDAISKYVYAIPASLKGGHDLLRTNMTKLSKSQRTSIVWLTTTKRFPDLKLQ